MWTIRLSALAIVAWAFMACTTTVRQPKSSGTAPANTATEPEIWEFEVLSPPQNFGITVFYQPTGETWGYPMEPVDGTPNRFRAMVPAGKGVRFSVEVLTEDYVCGGGKRQVHNDYCGPIRAWRSWSPEKPSELAEVRMIFWQLMGWAMGDVRSSCPDGQEPIRIPGWTPLQCEYRSSGYREN